MQIPSDKRLEERLTTAFTSAYAETYYRACRAAMAQSQVHPALLSVTNSILMRMAKRKVAAHTVVKDVLPTLETELGRQMAMAAATLITLHELPAGRRISMLPKRPL